MWKKFQMPPEFLSGRSDDPTFKRWAQLIQNDTEPQKKSVLIAGYASHAGVLANLGRAGADKGPDAFRSAFYRMNALTDVSFVDLGDYTSTESAEASHAWLRKNLPQEKFPLRVSLGGGHDYAAVDFDSPNMQIIHIDTHLDVRPYEKNKIHSGMPFRYLVEKEARIWCFGAQREYHTAQDWAFAQSNFKGLWSLDDLEHDFAKALDRCFTDIDPLKPLALSIDLDAFPQAISPGVSAPSPRGISINQTVRILDAVAKNLTHLGFYELNPSFDWDYQSARLGAFLFSRILQKKFS